MKLDMSPLVIFVFVFFGVVFIEVALYISPCNARARSLFIAVIGELLKLSASKTILSNRGSLYVLTEVDGIIPKSPTFIFTSCRYGLKKVVCCSEFCANRIYILSKFSTLVDKCCRMNMSTVLKTYQLISEQYLETAVQLLIEADVIYLFGVGGSAIVANDLQQKLIRIGKKVIYNDDLHVQMTFAESMTNHDVAIFISYSGTTKGLVDMAKLLKSKKINVISITQYTQNPIGKSSSVNLVVPCEEKSLRLGAISSRISSLVITDLLYYGVFKDDLERNKQKLIESRKIVSEI